jgi:hypothetical protein
VAPARYSRPSVVCALNWEHATKFSWRPDFHPCINEFVADFALVRKAALDEPGLASRILLFRLYYLGIMPYDRARHLLGLSEPNCVTWTEQVRRRCG